MLVVSFLQSLIHPALIHACKLPLSWKTRPCSALSFVFLMVGIISLETDTFLVRSSQSAGAAPNQNDIRLLEITRLPPLSFIIRGVIRQVMERRAAPGPSFLIKGVITMQILTLCWLRCLKDWYHFYVFKAGETPEPSRVSDDTHFLIHTRRKSYESLRMNKVGNEIGNERATGLSAALPSLHLSAHLPQSLSTHSSDTGLSAFLRLVQHLSSCSFIFLHLVSPSALSSFPPLCSALTPPSTCVRQSHSLSIFSDRQWSMGGAVRSGDNSRGAQGREMQWAETSQTTELSWVTELRALDYNEKRMHITSR